MTDLSAKFDGLRGQIASNHSLVLSRLISIDAKLDALGSIDGELQASNTALDSIAINMQKIADTVARKPSDDFPESSMFQLLANTFLAIAAIREAIRPQGQQNPTIQPRGMEWSLALIREDMQFLQDYIGGTITGPNLQQALSNLSLNTALIGQYTQFVQEYIGGTITGPNLQQALSNLSLNTATIGQNVNGVIAAVEANTQATIDCCAEPEPPTGVCAAPARTHEETSATLSKIVTSNGLTIVESSYFLNFSGAPGLWFGEGDWNADGDTVQFIQSGIPGFYAMSNANEIAVQNDSTHAVFVHMFPSDGSSLSIMVASDECYPIPIGEYNFFAVSASPSVANQTSLQVVLKFIDF